MKYCDEICHEAYRKYPQLRVKDGSPEFESDIVNATQILRETTIVEALNLKASIYFKKNQADKARLILSRVP